MSFHPVGVDSETNLFPTRIMAALKSIFPLTSDVEVMGLLSSTKAAIAALYPTKTQLASVATSGRYDDLLDKPSLSSLLVEDANDPGTYVFKSIAESYTFLEDQGDPGTFVGSAMVADSTDAGTFVLKGTSLREDSADPGTYLYNK